MIDRHPPSAANRMPAAGSAAALAALLGPPAAAAGRDRGAHRHRLSPWAGTASSRSRPWSATAPRSTPSSPHHRGGRGRRLHRHLHGGGRALAPGRRRPDDHGRLPVRHAGRRPGRDGRRDHRRHHHLPDRQERGRRASRCAAPDRWPTKLADGFRADAFSYLLFLRLVPLFPFWLVNLAPALFGVRLAHLRGRDRDRHHPGDLRVRVRRRRPRQRRSRAQDAAYKACLAAGRADCRLDFDLGDRADARTAGRARRARRSSR